MFGQRKPAAPAAAAAFSGGSSVGVVPAQGAPPRAGSSAAAVVTAPPAGVGHVRLRRPWLRAVISVLVVAVAAAGGWWLWTQATTAVPVLAVRDTVYRGEVIASSDLVDAQLTQDAAIATVPAQRRSAVVGQRAAVDLLAGSVLGPESFTPEPLPGRGQALVGLTVPGSQVPSRALRPGDEVVVVSTPKQGDDPPSGAPQSMRATVVSIGDAVAESAAVRTVTGQVKVDLMVPAESAATLAARGSTGRVALVLPSEAK